MNLKYYLRGLGLGIVVTAVIMGVATGGKKDSISNEEIKIRAKELGMVEDKVLAEYKEEKESEAEPEAAQEPKETKEDTEATEPVMEETAETKEVIPKAITADTDEVGMSIGNAGEVVVEEDKIFSIKKGESPYSIAERMEKEGLVISADDFDTFLLNNGYDRKIVAAEYTIPGGADETTIARIITGEKIE